MRGSGVGIWAWGKTHSLKEVEDIQRGGGRMVFPARVESRPSTIAFAHYLKWRIVRGSLRVPGSGFGVGVKTNSLKEVEDIQRGGGRMGFPAIVEGGPSTIAFAHDLEW